MAIGATREFCHAGNSPHNTAVSTVTVTVKAMHPGVADYGESPVAAPQNRTQRTG